MGQGKCQRIQVTHCNHTCHTGVVHSCHQRSMMCHGHIKIYRSLHLLILKVLWCSGTGLLTACYSLFYGGITSHMEILVMFVMVLLVSPQFSALKPYRYYIGIMMWRVLTHIWWTVCHRFPLGGISRDYCLMYQHISDQGRAVNYGATELLLEWHHLSYGTKGRGFWPNITH